MSSCQSGILAPIPAQARYLYFTLLPGMQNIVAALQALQPLVDGENTVAGIGQSLTAALGVEIPGLRVFPSFSERGIDIPSTPAALWLWLRGDDRGKLLHRAREMETALAPAFKLTASIDAFRYRAGDDLTGYEDGTENPTDDDAFAAAVLGGTSPGLDGSSFVAVQQWLHALDVFEAMPPEQQDHTFGRRKLDNEEIEDAPESAHVKRTAQEDFDPEAFVVRRSMPWSDAQHAGLVFVAFGKSFDAYEMLLRRMIGLDDGITDALFNFTRPLTGAYFWCPPTKDGKFDLSALGI